MISPILFPLAVIVNLNCAPVKIINETDTWTSMDSKTIRTAIKRCPVKYPDSPCLKKFWKKEERTYWALCGRPR